MNNLSSLSVAQLQRAITLKEQIEAWEAERIWVSTIFQSFRCRSGCFAGQEEEGDECSSQGQDCRSSKGEVGGAKGESKPPSGQSRADLKAEAQDERSRPGQHHRRPESPVGEDQGSQAPAGAAGRE